MSAITFKATLRAIREEGAKRFPDDTFIVQFLDRWLKELRKPADLEIWDKIANDAEKLPLERERVFRAIVTIACDGLALYDPKFGLRASKDLRERGQREKNNFKKLAASASALAEYYRGVSESSFDREKSRQERVALYEKEAKTFQHTTTKLEFDWDPHRQDNSAKRNDAWSRRKFVEWVAMYMKACFNRRYPKAVMVMTDLAFPPGKNSSTTVKEVNDICQSLTRR